jgi:hypothetical protein
MPAAQVISNSAAAMVDNLFFDTQLVPNWVARIPGP